MGYTFRPLRREVPMPWKETSPVEERLRFVARLLRPHEALDEIPCGGLHTVATSI
jgi:hypothetical protein